MSDIKTAINSIGILLSILGIWLAYKNSPLNEWLSDGGDASTDWSIIERQTKRKNRLMTWGIYTVIFGTTLQLISNFIPSGP